MNSFCVGMKNKRKRKVKKPHTKRGLIFNDTEKVKGYFRSVKEASSGGVLGRMK